MSDLLTITFVSVGSALLATLLTIFLTPRLQHHFWKYQRRAELRLTATDEINNLAAEFITKYREAERTGNHNFIPSIEFFQSFDAAEAKVKALFSTQTFQVFKNMEVMIGPHLGPKGKRTVDDFIQARDATMRSLYKEIGILPWKLCS